MVKKRIKESWGWMVVPEDYEESSGDTGIQRVIDSGQFPSVRSGEGYASMSSKGRRLRETIDRVKKEPINIARGHRTMAQQEREYGKIFEENSKVTKRVRRDSRMRRKSSERFELAGQIPREALLQAARESGCSVSEVVKDTDHMNRIAKTKGYLNS